MTLSDLKYITQDNIDEAHINITSAEMYTEFRDFNQHMSMMRRRRWRYLSEFYSMLLVDMVLIPIINILSGKYTQLMEPVKEPVLAGLSLGLLVLFMFLYCFLVLYKKIYSWKICLCFTLLTVPMRNSLMWYIIALFYVLLNCWLVQAIRENDDYIKGEVGYPYFVELVPSFICDPEELDGKSDMDKFEDADESDDLYRREAAPEENPFDKYRIKPEDDQGLLRDTDIGKGQ